MPILLNTKIEGSISGIFFFTVFVQNAATDGPVGCVGGRDERNGSVHPVLKSELMSSRNITADRLKF